MGAALIAVIHKSMDHTYTSVRKILEKGVVEASAPCRIDSGGTWDIKSLALPLERIKPATVNMALNLRARVSLSPFEDGRVQIRSRGFRQQEVSSMDHLPFNSPFGIFFAAVSYFGFHGLTVDIRSEFPVKSALGGSSTALVALIKALSRVRNVSGKKGLSGNEILSLAYNLEDGVSGGNCGSQDQAAAVYGGVNIWVWRYGNRNTFLKRESLLGRRGMKELSDWILVAYSGESHVSLDTNRGYIQDFLSGRTRSGWVKANDIVHRFGRAIKERRWNRAVHLLRKEMAVRMEITPGALIPVTEELIHQAEEAGCGARFAGAGAGGCVWALGEPDLIERLKGLWSDTLSPYKDARMLHCAIDPVGVT